MKSLIEQLQEVIASQAEKPPKGMRTMKTIEAEEKLSVNVAKDAVAAMVKSGKWHMKKYKVMVGGSLRPTPHYGPKC
jgi:hypothetical protein